MNLLFSRLLFAFGFRLILWSKVFQEIVAFKDENDLTYAIFLGLDEENLKIAAKEYIN